MARVRSSRHLRLLVLIVASALVTSGVLFWALYVRGRTGWPFNAEEARRRQSESTAKLACQSTRSVDLGDGVTIDMVLIPPGEFDLGSPSNEKGHETREAPIRRVQITRPYWIGRTEVTQAQWQAVMSTTVAQQRDRTVQDKTGGHSDWPLCGEGADYPMYYVSWEECQEFCRRLSQRKGLKVHLPTEAQWEYACRAGSSSRYCFGDSDSELDQYACSRANSGERTRPVATKSANAWGLHDMHGNVHEWCSDSYDGASRLFRVIRGGSFASSAGDCRCASRGKWPYNLRFLPLGLRVVASVE